MKNNMKGQYFVQGIPVPETPSPKKHPKPWGDTRVVGKPLPRVDAYERVSGGAEYPSDVNLPDMLYGAVLRCPHPHARVTSVDVSVAEKMPGVRAVIAGSTPEADVSWPYSKDVRTKLFAGVCRHEGEEVAAVAAETPYQARDAAMAIKVAYEVLPFVVDELKAATDHAELGRPKVDRYERGNVEKGFAEADLVLEETYRTECEIHTPMELHGCVARWDRDGLTIWESTQGVFSVQARVAEVLKLPLSKVRVIGHYVGGGFGSKLQAGKYTIIASVLSRLAGCPVKLFLTREETFLAVGNRPPATMKIKAGVRRDGTLTALSFSATATGGAYPAGGTSLLDWLVRDLYTCSNVKTETTDVFINGGPSRPFRAPGHPQCSWALEQMLDSLAAAVGMDPVDLRLRNIPLHSQAREGRPRYTSTGLRECIEKGAAEFGWKEARARTAAQKDGRLRRGVGMASCLWFAGGGGPPSTVIVRMFSDGSVNLNMGASDIGTGTKTVMAMVVAEELHVDADQVQIEHADTGTTQYATPSGGSKTVPTESPAVRAAALSVRKQLLEMAAEELRVDEDILELRLGEIVVSSDPGRRIALNGLTGLKKRGVVVGVGYRGPNPEGMVVNPFAAQFCEVEVNMMTGEVKILRFLGAHESGRVMDSTTFDCQVYGGITMGIGLAMSEMRIFDRDQTGKVVNPNLHDYKIPTAFDVPVDMVSLRIEIRDDLANTTGAKGLGEPVTIPTAAAIANAVHDATGLRFTSTPVSPMEVSVRLSAGEGRKQS